VPHLTIGYSANLDGKVEMVGLCRALLAAILASGLFEMGAIRVRAVRCAAYAVADLLAENAFADLWLRIGAGRSAADKARAGRRSIRCMRPRCGVYRDRSRRGGHCGGGRCQIRGAGGGYVSPTLFTGAHNQMRIAQEEIFGPVLTAPSASPMRWRQG
jgi:5-carboxymethyl-2-hydroxymuconate isomerase